MTGLDFARKETPPAGGTEGVLADTPSGSSVPSGPAVPADHAGSPDGASACASPLPDSAAAPAVSAVRSDRLPEQRDPAAHDPAAGLPASPARPNSSAPSDAPAEPPSLERILALGTDDRRDPAADFAHTALELFRFQAARCAPYRDYLKLIGVDPASVDRVERIPFLPVELFRSHEVYCGPHPPEVVFTSSTTGGDRPSRHIMARLADYERTYLAAFARCYGPPERMPLYALLPSYLERSGSSLVTMAAGLIARGGGGFFLHDHDELIRQLEADRRPKILLGVSYALWDLAERHAPKLHDTIVMETGGMKGRREELPREELHRILCRGFGVERIHSEYGMAELASQAYSDGGGRFTAPPWMRVLVRDAADPFDLRSEGRGALNLIDLANRYSCAFLQTRDVGRVDGDGRFTVEGRLDRSQIRGCNLLIQ